MRKKLTGRVLALALCALVAVSSCIAAFAVSGTVTIKECDDLQLTLPENMTAVTRSTESTDPYFAQHKISYEAMQRLFDEGDCYLHAMDNESATTLTLSYLDTDARDLNELSAEELFGLARGFLGGTASNIQYETCTPDEPGGEPVWLFLELNTTDASAQVTRQFQATTVFSGKNITLTLTRNTGDVTAADYATLESVVRSVKANRVFPWGKIAMVGLIIVGVLLLIILAVVVFRMIKKSRGSKPDDDHDDTPDSTPVVAEEPVTPEPAAKRQLRPRPEIKEDKKTPAPTKNEPAEPKSDVKSEPKKETAPDAPKPKKLVRKDFSAKNEKAPEKTDEKPAEKQEKQPVKKPVEKPAAKQEVKEDISSNSAAKKQPETKQEKKPEAPKPEQRPQKPVTRPASDDKPDYDDTPIRKYSDEDIERLLAD